MLKEGSKAKGLEQYIGSWLVLYFYPRDMTPGCTIEACAFRDNYEIFTKQGIKIVGISADSEVRHKKFIEKYDLPFELISDEDRLICENFGVWQLKKFMGKEYMGIIRSTFIIDSKGTIVRVYPKVKVKEHIEELLNDITELK